MTIRASQEAVLDVRSYALVPGSAEEFDRLFRERSLPLLESFGIHTVAFGPSLGDPERYLLVWAFDSEFERIAQLDAFCVSTEWEDAVLPLIESVHQFVIPMRVV